MGVFDFLKKTTQNDDDGQDQSQTYTPMQTQAAPQSDVQASYGSFFSSTKPAGNVTYPLPAAGATLTPNYGAGVPVPASDDTDDKTTTTTVKTDEKPLDKLDITNTSFVVEDKTSLPPVQVTDDPLLIKGDNIIQPESHNDLFLNPPAPTNVPAPTQEEKAKVDSLDMSSSTELDFNAPLPDLTASVSKQLETPLLPGAEPIEVNKAAPSTTLNASQTPLEENKTIVAPEVVANTGNDTETPSKDSFDDFNPPLDSLVFNTGDGKQGNWNPENAFMSASNEGISDKPKDDLVAEVKQDDVTPEVNEEATTESFLNDLVINKDIVAPAVQDPVNEAEAPIQETKEDADSIDWLKDLETQPLDMQHTAETTSKEFFPEPKPLTAQDDLPEWMKEFESMQFNPSEAEAPKPEPAKDLVTTLPVVEDTKKSKKEKKETKETGEEKNVEEVKTPAIETNEPQTTTLQLKYFRDVALVGLNSDSSDSNYTGLVQALVTALKTSAARLIIDSSQGYGKVVLDSLKDAMNLEINGAYLRPYFSAYSDEPNGEVIDVKNYTETLFSNFIERLRYLYTSAELFIVLDSKGLVNTADITFLLAMQKMYYGKHKPVILFGAGWKEKMSTLGSLLNEDEKDKVYIVGDVNELAGVLKKIEEGYSKNNYYSTKRVTDLRDIEDEKQFMI